MAGIDTTPEETRWMSEHPGLPVLNYDAEVGEVGVKILKSGISADAFLGKVTSFDTYARSEYVETSCGFLFQGQVYALTATRINQGPYTSFSPVFTEITIDDDASDGVVGTSWKKVDDAMAIRLLESAEFAAALTPILPKASVEASLAEYLDDIRKNLDEVSVVQGSHSYDVTAGIYEYRQRVVSDSAAINSLVKWFGENKLKEFALKICYNAIGDEATAGPEIGKGTPVTTMSGETLVPSH